MYRHALFLLALLPLALTAPTAKNDLDIEVIWTLDKPSSTYSLRAWTRDYSSLIGEVCNTSLSTGNFANSALSLDVNKNGYGTLKYGSQTYNVSSKPETSGGITCHKRYNSHFARVNCIIPYQKQDDHSPLPVDEDAACFPGEVLRMWHATTSYRNTTSPLPLSTKRSDCGDAFQSPATSVKVGDGNPHQNYYNQQVTPSVACGTATQCNVGQQQAHSITVGFTSDVLLTEWLSGGFSVEESFEDASQEGCTGSAGETICLWHQTVLTAYTVKNIDGCGNPTSKPFVLESPNKNQGLQYSRQFYCVDGPCRSQHDAYWDYSGPASGPPK